LVSFLEGNGTPTQVERAMVRPPAARIGPITPAERKAVMDGSPVKGKYDQTIERESAFEKLQKSAQSEAGPAEHGPAEPGPAGQPGQAPGGVLDKLGAIVATIFGTSRKRGERLTTSQAVARDITRTVTNRVAGQIAADIGKKLAGSTGSSVGRAIVRGTLGGMLRR
jgi:DNA double-strand break repair helicase HerA and related ATPase